ncbi:MAG: HYR domain-containing protein, partial [Bacteroidota bacterium]
STDACGITTRTLSKTAYTCADLGASSVTLTLSDASGNTSTCTGTVTVQDITSPTAVCQNVTAALVGNSVTVTAAQVNNNSTDNCGIASMSLSTSSFTCANRGSNNVTLTVTDASGNAGNCAAVVTVIDNTPPVASCQNISVNLSGAGTASITASQVNNSSTDNCGTPSVSVTPTTFSCNSSGGNTVTLTATDGSGNTSTCTATITVSDNIQPTITTCPSNQTITNCIAPSYTGSVVATDNCTIASITQSPAAGASLGIGHGQSTSITYTVTDQSGNIRTCSNTVTVNDQTPPTATCNNLTVTLDPLTNQATVNASQLTTNSTDACNPVTSIVPAWTASPGSCAGAVCLAGGTSFPALRNGGGTYTYTKTSCLGSSRNESWFYFRVTSPGTIIQTISIAPSSDVDYACWGPFTSITDGCNNLSVATQKSCNYSGANGGVMNFNAPVGYYIMVVTNFGNQAGNITLSNNTGSATVAACSSVSGSATSYVYNQTNLGQNTVTLQVTDAAGNSSTCNAVVTVQVNDPVPPVARCKNVSVDLDGSNSATIRDRDIDDGSTDNVAVSSYTLSNSIYNCSNIGTNVVILTVSDPAGNTATCNSIVTVNDVVAPTFADPADVTLTTSAAADCPTPAIITLVASQATPVATSNAGFSYTVHGKTHSGPTSYSDNCATGSDLKLYCWAINTDNTGAANNCSRQIRITWRVYDKNNANYTEQTQLFTINDNTIPTFTRPADITINTAANCTPDLTPANTGDVLNEDDNCANASSITLVSPNDPASHGIPSDTRHCVTMVSSQNVTFDWTYSTLDLDPTHDPFGYSINGIFTQLSDDIGASTHSGSETIPVLAGAEFCLILSTIDNRGGSATTVIDRFIANQLIAATYVDGTSVNLGCPGEFYFDRTWSLSDGCGNAAASQVQRITVLDRTAPVVTTTNNSLDPDIDNYICGTAYTFNAGPQLCFLSKTIAKPEWIDACGSTVTRTQSATNNVTISNYGSFVSVDFPVGTTT